MGSNDTPKLLCLIKMSSWEDSETDPGHSVGTTIPWNHGAFGYSHGGAGWEGFLKLDENRKGTFEHLSSEIIMFADMNTGSCCLLLQ